VAIAFRAASAQVLMDAGTTLTPANPAGTLPTDILIACFEYDGGTGITITPPTGWTLIAKSDNGATCGTAAYWALGNVASNAFGFTSTTAIGWILGYSGVDPNTPMDVAATNSVNTSSVTGTCPSITTKTPGAVCVCICGFQAQSATFSGQTFTERMNGAEGGTSDPQSMDSGDFLAVAAGATAAKTTTSSVAALNNGITAALRPLLAGVSQIISVARTTARRAHQAVGMIVFLHAPRVVVPPPTAGIPPATRGRLFSRVLQLRGGIVPPAAPANSRIHIVQAAQPHRPGTHVIYIHGAPSTVPQRLPTQPVVVQVRNRPAPTHVIALRGGQFTPAPKMHVVLARNKPQPTHVVYVHGAKSTVPQKLPAQPYVVQARIRPPTTRVVYIQGAPAPPAAPPAVAGPSPATRGRFFSRVVFLRGSPLVAPAVPPPPQQIHVVQARIRPPATHVISQHNPGGLIAPSAPQYTAVLVERSRQHVKTSIVQLRGAESVVPAKLAPQVHVVQVQHRPAYGKFVFIRNAAVPPPPPQPPTVQVHVVQVAHRPAKTNVIYVHGAPSTVPLRLAPQITIVQQRIRPAKTHVISIAGHAIPPVVAVRSPNWEATSSTCPAPGFTDVAPITVPFTSWAPIDPNCTC